MSRIRDCEYAVDCRYRLLPTNKRDNVRLTAVFVALGRARREDLISQYTVYRPGRIPTVSAENGVGSMVRLLRSPTTVSLKLIIAPGCGRGRNSSRHGIFRTGEIGGDDRHSRRSGAQLGYRMFRLGSRVEGCPSRKWRTSRRHRIRVCTDRLVRVRCPGYLAYRPGESSIAVPPPSDLGDAISFLGGSSPCENAE